LNVLSFAADFSFAAIAILGQFSYYVLILQLFYFNDVPVRLVVPTALHIVGVVFTILAWIYSLTGYFKKNNGALYSAILYILGGLCPTFKDL
jgi:multisubunit Na+/H+ antiporter MnhG subunit